MFAGCNITRHRTSPCDVSVVTAVYSNVNVVRYNDVIIIVLVVYIIYIYCVSYVYQ
jgi:hypothetical protein